MVARSTGGGKKETPKKSSRTKAKSTAKSTAKVAKVAKVAKAKVAKKMTVTATKPAAVVSSAPKVAKKTTKRAAAKPAKAAKLRVRQVRSAIGRRRDLRRTLTALGLKHHQDEIVVKQNPAIDGMLSKVRHLIRVTPED
jgi:large subunit ribosomal protein L30